MNGPGTPGGGSGTKLGIVQINLHHSKTATADLLKVAEEKGYAIALVQEPYTGSSGRAKQYPGTRVIQCSSTNISRQTPVKAAIYVFGDQFRIIHDPQLVSETESAAVLEAGRFRLGVVSVYFDGGADIGPYIERTKSICESLNTPNILLAGDVNAWSYWWGEAKKTDARKLERGTKYCDFINEMEFHILNTGNTPTFEVWRNDVLCTSIVDVTACSTSLLGKIRNWRVDKELITSDHNAITCTLELGERLQHVKAPTTRVYNTKKANWPAFDETLLSLLAEKDITPARIEEIASPEEMETLTEAYTTAIREACESAIPKIGKKRKGTVFPWWTNEIAELKRDLVRKKKRIVNAAPHRKERVLQEYNEAKALYAKQSAEAQTHSWKEFCTKQDKESMWDGVYRVLRKTAGRKEELLLRGPDGKTLDPKQSADLLANTFYPEDTVNTDTPHHTQLRKIVQETPLKRLGEMKEDDPPFTEAELESVLQEQNPKKAPGPDGFTSDICARAIRCSQGAFLAIANKCLAMPCFPKQWKIAHVVILNKPGKDDYTSPKSYRPIGLLSVLGKTLEKLFVRRLQWHLLPTLSSKQYGFLPQRGTEDALYDLMKHVKTEQEAGISVVIVSLDIEGAFDNAWWPALMNQLRLRRCPKNLYLMVDSYLKDRKIVVNYSGETSERETTKGCVQGSIGGPTFWNIILDPLLQKLSSEEVYCQAFADDGVLVFSGKSIEGMEDRINRVLEVTVEWGKENKLNFAAHKTQVMLLTKKLKYTPPQITMSGTTLALVDEIKLLGLTIDRRLNFNSHVRNICTKAARLYKQLTCAARVTWGLNGEIIRTIYVAVIEPIATYGACAWAKASENITNRKALDALQRGFAQRICKAYRTTSLPAVLILAGILPLDLRIQEVASLYEAKKGLSVDYLPPNRKLEEIVKAKDLPHPATQLQLEYTLLEDTTDAAQTALQITGPQIFTDGSKMEGKVGAALTWWEDGKEIHSQVFSLDSTCTVFQSELYALHRAVSGALESGEAAINIFSDSRSSLDLLCCTRLTHPLAKAIKESIAEIRSRGRRVRLFWIRSHVGTAGNERADELAKEGALKETSSPDYAEVPLSFVRRKIREESIAKWQDRFDTASQGAVTRTFLPNVSKAYSVVRGTKLNHLHAQILTGHGGFGEYLHRFRLKASPGCECDPNVSESVWHLLLDCPRFQTARYNLECICDQKLRREVLWELLDNKKTRSHFLKYIEEVAAIATKRNKTIDAQPSTNTNTTDTTHTTQPSITPTHTQVMQNPSGNQDQLPTLLKTGEAGRPRLRIRGVAMFMDNNSERVGVAFCNDRAKRNIYLSPGLGLLLNGSTSKTTMRRKVYDALPTVTVGSERCRIVRRKNKTIALFATDDRSTAFEKACSVLTGLGERESRDTHTPRVLSIDAMAVSYHTGETRDHLGALQASKHHEVMIYENRGQDLGFLLRRGHGENDASESRRGGPTRDTSGSERLQQALEEESRLSKQKSTDQDEDRRKSTVTSLLNRIAQAIASPVKEKMRKLRETETQETAVEKFTTPSTSRQEVTQTTQRTKADMGLVTPPRLKPANDQLAHMGNALREFLAITAATRKVNKDICSAILRTYKRGNMKLLEVKLEEAEAAIYDLDAQRVLHGRAWGQYMAAYCATEGFIELEKCQPGEEGHIQAINPPRDPKVVLAKCTRVMLEDRILEMANTTLGDLTENTKLECLATTAFTWVNGVPGCGKTTWVVAHANIESDLIVTATREAVKDLRDKLIPRVGEGRAKQRVRTMASLLVNGMRKGESCTRLVVDEALMIHFGSIVMAIKIAGASETMLIGDYNQLPFIDRNNLFPLKYSRPHTVTNVKKELLCTYRNPQDVAYALSEVYSGIYSAKNLARSLALKEYKGANIPKSKDTLYLTHTQAEKELLISQGYGADSGSCTLTIHEAQGRTFETVIVVRTTTKKSKLPQSVPHAVVAISRHTKTCVYYVDNTKHDAIARFIQRAERATAASIRDYNLKMAIWNGDDKIRDCILASEAELEEA
jgi:ribonuclease HI